MGTKYFYGKPFNIEPEYFTHDGMNNSVIKVNGKKYRKRVETLVIKDDTVYVARKKGIVIVPGGSTEPDVDDITQAIHECQEEAHITPKELKYIGYYVTDYDSNNPRPKWMDDLVVKYDGIITLVYIGKYHKAYNKYVKLRDRSQVIANGDFVPIESVIGEMNDIHKEALLHRGDKYMSIESIIADLGQYASESVTRRMYHELFNDNTEVIEAFENAGYNELDAMAFCVESVLSEPVDGEEATEAGKIKALLKKVSGDPNSPAFLHRLRKPKVNKSSEVISNPGVNGTTQTKSGVGNSGLEPYYSIGSKTIRFLDVDDERYIKCFSEKDNLEKDDINRTKRFISVITRDLNKHSKRIIDRLTDKFELYENGEYISLWGIYLILTKDNNFFIDLIIDDDDIHYIIRLDDGFNVINIDYRD